MAGNKGPKGQGNQPIARNGGRSSTSGQYVVHGASGKISGKSTKVSGKNQSSEKVKSAAGSALSQERKSGSGSSLAGSALATKAKSAFRKEVSYARASVQREDRIGFVSAPDFAKRRRKTHTAEDEALVVRIAQAAQQARIAPGEDVTDLSDEEFLAKLFG